MDKILFAKTKNNAIIPTKRDEDSCYDLYACFDEDEIRIKPTEIALIPTGLCSVFDKKYAVSFRERGSNTKTKLSVRAGVIDSGYRGEWFVALQNTTNHDIIIAKDNLYREVKDVLVVDYKKALCQFEVKEVPVVEIKEITLEELNTYKSERMNGCLGSSGK